MDSKASPVAGAIVLSEIMDGNIGIVTMNNPHQLNSLSSDLVAGILDAFDEFEKADIRALILRA